MVASTPRTLTSGKNKRLQAGFTLIEIMVALFVITVALAGAIKVMGNAANNSLALSDKSFARWVAMNQYAELRLSGEWPRPGETKGKSEMAYRDWRWVQTIKKTEDQNVNRVEISVWNVTEEEESPSASLVAFLAKP